MRWVLLEEVLGIEKKVRARARSRVPGAGFSPELLMIEMMAQTGALLLGAESDFLQDVVFAKIQNADFICPYHAGEQIEIHATSENLRPEGAWIQGAIQGERGEIARSNLMLMTVPGLLPEKSGPITFHQDFMNHYHVREKVN